MELYFWTFVVAILIFALGAGLSFYQGLEHALHPEPLGSLNVSYAVLVLAMLLSVLPVTDKNPALAQAFKTRNWEVQPLDSPRGGVEFRLKLADIAPEGSPLAGLEFTKRFLLGPRGGLSCIDS